MSDVMEEFMSNLMKKMSGLLTDKPLWVWLIVYLVITGVLFGLSNLVIYLLGIIPFVGVLVLVVAGLLWGFIAFASNNKQDKKPSKKTDDK